MLQFSREKTSFRPWNPSNDFFYKKNQFYFNCFVKKNKERILTERPLNVFIFATEWNVTTSCAPSEWIHVSHTESAISTNFIANENEWVSACVYVLDCQCLTDWHPNELKIRKESTNNSRGTNEKRREWAHICVVYFFFVSCCSHSSFQCMWVCVQKKKKKYRVKKYGRKWSIERQKKKFAYRFFTIVLQHCEKRENISLFIFLLCNLACKWNSFLSWFFSQRK